MSESPPSFDSPTQSRVVTGALRPTIFWLALPVFFEQLLNSLVGFVDTILSGHLGESISASATSAVGLSAYTGWLAAMLFALVGTGTTALVSRTWGAGEYEQANRIANRSIAIVAVMGFAMYLLLFSLAPVITTLLDMTPEQRQLTIRYLRLDAFGLIPMGISLVGSAALHGTGDMRSPMWIFGFVNVLNIFASSALAFGIGPFPNWGIDGIVAGTLIARYAGALLLLAGLARGLSGLKLARSELRLRGETARRILRIGAPAAVDGAITWSGHFLFLVIIGHLGTEQASSSFLAAHFIGIRMEGFVYLPAAAWGTAAATVVGQSLGALNPARAVNAGNEAIKQCLLPAIVVTILFFFGAETIFTLMHDDPAVRAAGVPAFRILGLLQVPHVVFIIYLMALRGAGDTRYPLIVTAFAMYFFRLPIAYVCGILLDGGLLGAWMGMYVDMAVRAILATIRYWRGKWVETVV